MLVKDRMSGNPVFISPETTVPDALALMEKKGIRRLPVVAEGRLVGIVTLLDLLHASPSPGASLSIWELNYLLAKLPVKGVMSKEMLTVSPDVPIDEAALMMRENRIGGLPVVKDGKLVGVITETDIFTAFLELLGVDRGELRLTLELPDRPGSLAEAAEIFHRSDINVVSLAMLPSAPGAETGQSVWRLDGCSDVKALVGKLEEKGFRVLYINEAGAA
jgi:acetoin utilization protein AcuB